MAYFNIIPLNFLINDLKEHIVEGTLTGTSGNASFSNISPNTSSHHFAKINCWCLLWEQKHNKALI